MKKLKFEIAIANIFDNELNYLMYLEQNFYNRPTKLIDNFLVIRPTIKTINF